MVMVVSGYNAQNVTGEVIPLGADIPPTSHGVFRTGGEYRERRKRRKLPTLEQLADAEPETPPETPDEPIEWGEDISSGDLE